MNNCDHEIHEALATLDVAQDRVQEFLSTDEACVVRLVSLHEECSTSMIRVAHGLLCDTDRNDNEYKLQVLLRALFQRKHPQTLDLVITALLGSTASDKETYVTFLLEFEDSRVVATLADFVASAPVTGSDEAIEDEGWALVKAIEALRHYRVAQATPSILARMEDRSDRVRRAAIDFLVELDVQSAAPSFTRRLEQEDDPDNVRALVDGLVRWNHVAVLPQLQRLRDGGLARDNEALRNAVSDAIKALTAEPP